MYKIEKKKHAVISLWDKTSELAKKENKTPVVVLCQKFRNGFWIIVKDTDLNKIKGYGHDRKTNKDLSKKKKNT